VLMVVSCFGVIVFVLGFSRFRFAFEGAAGTQDCTFRARSPMLRPRAENEGNTAPFGRWNASLNGTGVSRKGQTAENREQGSEGASEPAMNEIMERPGNRCGIGSALGELGLANVGQKSWMGGAALGVVGAGFFETELAVDG